MLDDFRVPLRQPNRFDRTPQESCSLSGGNGLDKLCICIKLECTQNDDNSVFLRIWTFRKGNFCLGRFTHLHAGIFKCQSGYGNPQAIPSSRTIHDQLKGEGQCRKYSTGAFSWDTCSASVAGIWLRFITLDFRNPIAPSMLS